MKKSLRVALPLVILGSAAATIWYFVATRPDPDRKVFRPPPPDVKVEVLQPRSYPVVLRSQGTVRARTESTLAAEVRGRINSISPSFREGGFFEEGDVLLQIDPRDYETELVTAEAALVQAELRLLEEQARFEQAKVDWERLNPGQPATPLALREPQLRQAEAAVASATARVASARRDLERTRVRAPYAGRILTKNADVGQYVTAGNVLARIYAIDYAEVRLPLTESQLGFLSLEEAYRGDTTGERRGPPVRLTSSMGGLEYVWTGSVVRAEGAVDTRTRQLSVVAQVSNPYGRTEDERPPLKIGTFVEAEIEGTVLENVFVVPRRLFRESSYVLLIDADNRLRRRYLTPIWSANDEIVVRDGLRTGEKLCLTLIPYSIEGMEVAVQGTAGSGSYIERLLAAIPPDKPLPATLRDRLASAGDDQQKTRAVVGEIRAWAEQQGISLPRPGGNR